MGKITHAQGHIVVEMSVDELLMSTATVKGGTYAGYNFAGQVAAAKVSSTKLAAELIKMKRFKIERIGEKIVVTMDDVDLKK